MADELSCPIVDADRTRKHVLGVSETSPLPDRPWRGAYDPAVTERVYGEVLGRASLVLASGRPVIVDASFQSREFREGARRLAHLHGVRFAFVECRAPADICRQRLEQRAHTSTPSDGRTAIFDAFAARFEPIEELSPAEHIVLDTTRPLDQSLAQLRERIVTWPRGFTA